MLRIKIETCRPWKISSITYPQISILNKGKSVCNIVTCNEEIGAGTLGAAGGKFFSPIEPIPGYAIEGT